MSSSKNGSSVSSLSDDVPSCGGGGTTSFSSASKIPASLNPFTMRFGLLRT